MLLNIGDNTTLLYGMCKRGGDQQRNNPFTTLIRSKDAGKSWSAPTPLPHGLGQSAYSTRTGRITMLVGNVGPHSMAGLLGLAAGGLPEEPLNLLKFILRYFSEYLESTTLQCEV